MMTDDRRPLRVLVVDDLRDAADSLAALLVAWGYDARAAYDGADALALALADPPDCIVTDLTMPRLDGFALAAAVRAEPTLAGTKLVAVSALSDLRSVGRAIEVGFDHRLTKPADPDGLRELLAMMDNIKKLAETTEELARKNVELAAETKDLLAEVKDDIRDVKQEVKELKEEVRELKADRPD